MVNQEIKDLVPNWLKGMDKKKDEGEQPQRKIVYGSM